MTSDKIRKRETPSEIELECQLRKELGLSAWGMVENTWIPWRARIILELITRKGANTRK